MKLLAYTVSKISKDGLLIQVRVVVDDVVLGRELDLYISSCIPVPRKVAPIPRAVSYISTARDYLPLLHSATQAGIIVHATYPTFDGGMIFFTNNITRMEKLITEL